MLVVDAQQKLKERIKYWRQIGETIAFVPTMGNLHRGHLRLVEVAQQHASKVIVSIFVNPLQFPPGSDFESYPRTIHEDVDKLTNLNVDMVFCPDVATIYPHGMEVSTKVFVPELSNILCGEFRPGHFEGVATVVAKLFNLVQPDSAIFGEKDYQQLVIIKRMVADLQFAIDIVGVETIREENGLAMSSRNQYLSESERNTAGILYQTLKTVAQQVNSLSQENGDTYNSFSEIEQEAKQKLTDSGFKPEYVQVRDSDNLSAGHQGSRHLRVLAAAWLGKARLIDNLPIR